MTAQTDIYIDSVPPYDFGLSMRAINAFRPSRDSAPPDKWRLAVRVDGVASLVEIGQTGRESPRLAVSARPAIDRERLGQIARWVIFAELDLAPFYSLASREGRLKSLLHELKGLKPVRPPSLFEMAVTAIIEQQISLAAAYRVRGRLVERFGQKLEDLWIFPEAPALAAAALEDLQACGLSGQKAGYIRDLAGRIKAGDLNPEDWKGLSDQAVREAILQIRGFGRWSADYILVRGLARPDCLPVDDLTIRSVVGQYLGTGARLNAAEVAQVMQPFAPYRGLLAFYLLAVGRLSRSQSATKRA